MPQAYGIKFIITVDGLARKFSLKNTVLNVGNGLALLGITTVLCEFVLMYFIKVSSSVLYFWKLNCGRPRPLNHFDPFSNWILIFSSVLSVAGILWTHAILE